MMESLKVNQYGLTELNSAELQEVDGGIIWPAIAIAAAFVISAMNNWGDIREGWADGAAGASRY